MAEVGNVTLQLGLDRSGFDRQLKALSTVSTSIDLKATLNIAELERDLRSFQTATRTLNIQSTLDTKDVRRELESLTAQKLQPLVVEVKADPKSFEKLKREVRAKLVLQNIVPRVKIIATCAVAGLNDVCEMMFHIETLATGDQRELMVFTQFIKGQDRNVEPEAGC